MIKKTQLKITLILLLCVVLHLSSQSQIRKYFVINGNVVSELNSSEYSSVQIIKNNQKGISSQIPENGRFRLELEYNAEYQLIFSKNGNQPKAFIVNTEIPEKVMNNSSNFPRFLMTVKLLAGSLDSGNQIQHIYYSTQTDCFTTLQSKLNAEYVEKGNSDQNLRIQPHDYKAKL